MATSQIVCARTLRQIKRETCDLMLKLLKKNPKEIYALLEAMMIYSAMLLSDDNQTKAAKILSFSRGTLRNKLKIYFDATQVIGYQVPGFAKITDVGNSMSILDYQKHYLFNLVTEFFRDNPEKARMRLEAIFFFVAIKSSKDNKILLSNNVGIAQAKTFTKLKKNLSTVMVSERYNRTDLCDELIWSHNTILNNPAHTLQISKYKYHKGDAWIKIVNLPNPSKQQSAKMQYHYSSKTDTRRTKCP